MAEEKILTKHPQGKTGRNISKKTYDTMKTAIIAALEKKELTQWSKAAALSSAAG
jgi:hypothetical protein